MEFQVSQFSFNYSNEKNEFTSKPPATTTKNEDMNDTKRLLVHTANTFVPVSVIIIGVGGANKEKMRILDGDNRTLTSNEGVRAKRDIVQFVGELT